MNVNLCSGCLSKMRDIDRLKKENHRLQDENRRLRKKLGLVHRHIHEQPFGSSTPSSKQHLKPSSPEERRAKRGGGQKGHQGHGRKRYGNLPEAPPEHIPVPGTCPRCGGGLEASSVRERTLISCLPPVPLRRDLKMEEAWCPHCHRTIRAALSDALPRALLDNSALSFVAMEHFLHGTTMGRISRIMGVGEGTLHNAMHRLAGIVAPAIQRLLDDYRRTWVRHADETGWRNDGANGFGWLFVTADTMVYCFRDTRAGSVAREIIGSKPLPGVLLVDRYGGYNRLPVKIQYCYAHLLRLVEDLQAEFPEEAEVQAFTVRLADALAQAMRLRREVPTLKPFRKRAAALKRRILRLVNSPARHAGVQNVQNVFRENRSRLYHWATSPKIPADNNYAERSLRPTVIARKLSFGSQSVRGAHTREILMSVIGTLAKRNTDPWLALKTAMDRFVEAVNTGTPANITELLFGVPAPPPPLH